MHQQGRLMTQRSQSGRITGVAQEDDLSTGSHGRWLQDLPVRQHIGLVRLLDLAQDTHRLLDALADQGGRLGLQERNQVGEFAWMVGCTHDVAQGRNRVLNRRRTDLVGLATRQRLKSAVDSPDRVSLEFVRMEIARLVPRLACGY
ncbi:hypothetical protein G6F68_015824 [Rhizopus microsporus]|nr:hypothetical protein G6F68_015824 [Rhizopus microsporus]